MTDGRVDRGVVLRAAVAALLIALLTAVGHVAGGGSLPDLAVLVVLLPLLAGVLVTLARVQRGPLGTVATLGAGQLALHQLLVLLQPDGAGHAAGHGGGHGVGRALEPAAMPLMHLVVTLVTAAGLLYAERGVLALRAALRRVVPRRLATPAVERPLSARPVPGPELPARLARALSVAHARRGPPVGC